MKLQITGDQVGKCVKVLTVHGHSPVIEADHLEETEEEHVYARSLVLKKGGEVVARFGRGSVAGWMVVPKGGK